MKQLKKDLQAVSNSLKALTRKTEAMAMAMALDKLEKAKASGKQKTKAKAKSTKKASAKEKAPAKKAPAKKSAAKKSAALTATDQVVNIIKRSKKGVDVPTLIKNTGFEDKKIRNIVFKASKQGRIKRAGRAVYVGA
ncbi:MAG: hypothetical protein JRJ38_07955 [Deltaproteobacteria bacterium]|nr:hypothetical protein [Deltaproteobacteria bacterium]